MLKTPAMASASPALGPTGSAIHSRRASPLSTRHARSKRPNGAGSRPGGRVATRQNDTRRGFDPLNSKLPRAVPAEIPRDRDPIADANRILEPALSAQIRDVAALQLPVLGRAVVCRNRQAVADVRVREPDARDLLRIVLESCGVTVFDAASAKDAMTALEGEQIDLIVSDIGMPEEDGYSLIRRLRALPNQAKAAIPALALTAFAHNEDRTRALLEGFNVHMTKPVEPAELLVALADLAGSVGRKFS